MWNMQSGQERRSFSLTGPAPGDSKAPIIAQSKGKAKSKAKAPVKSFHAITGLATDALNTMVIAATLEGIIYVCPTLSLKEIADPNQFFDFHTTKLIHKVQLPTSITAMNLHRDSGLMSVICDDLTIRLVDIETRRVVRELRGFKGTILDSVSFLASEDSFC